MMRNRLTLALGLVIAITPACDLGIGFAHDCKQDEDCGPCEFCSMFLGEMCEPVEARGGRCEEGKICRKDPKHASDGLRCMLPAELDEACVQILDCREPLVCAIGDDAPRRCVLNGTLVSGMRCTSPYAEQCAEGLTCQVDANMVLRCL